MNNYSSHYHYRFAYANNNPLIYTDPTGLAPRNISEDLRQKWKNFVQNFNNEDIPRYDAGSRDGQTWDCADLATEISRRAASLVQDAITLFSMRGNLVQVPDVHSSDYQNEDNDHFSFYRNDDGSIDNAFDSANVEAGTIGVFDNHIIIVTEDRESSDDPIVTLQGHKYSDATRDDIDDQAMLDSYIGTFLGWAEFGPNGTDQPIPEEPTYYGNVSEE